MERCSRLVEKFGPEIEMFDDGERMLHYRIVQEFAINGTYYVALQTPAHKKADEFEFFRVHFHGADGEPELESIVNLEEWEEVEEAFDDLFFLSDERP